jgi:uncharacterized glyoxalase superfamily protein PhnB
MASNTPARFVSAVPALPISDERRAVTFYVDVLGFVELLHAGKGLGILRRDDVELHLWVADGSGRGAERHLAGSASCRIQVTGIEALYDACVRHGVVHPNAPLLDQWWGTREFGVVDPDGNLIGLFEHLQK